MFLMGCQSNFHNSSSIDLTFDLTAAVDSEDREKENSWGLIFILSFIGGLLALMTPCVFPMIPMTVTFFTKQSKTRAEGIRKAGFYAFCIIIIYVILGVLISWAAGEDALNIMATNPWVNIGFFVLFMVFAISFLGAFEITLPSSWINKADKQADRGGMIGIFFMAFTLALVSFSCTGPIVGTGLVQSAQGGLGGPIIAMLGFSMALAIPFGLFAAFPGWLNSLPQSGGWLNTVKVVLGFLEMAFALKFLSNADLVKQWHIMERELFLGIWIGIFLVLAIYLFGLIRFPHDSKNENLSVGRGFFATIVAGFVIYLIPGMWGAPLKLISGFPPPLTYSESPYGIGNHAPDIPEGWPASTVAHGHGLFVVRDYYEALEFARKVDKPLLLDFTGWACVNCRRMEEFVWSDKAVAPIMSNDFVVASLYVDDRGELPEKYKGRKDRNGDEMETIGDLWMDMQVTRYQQVTQPMYVVLDHHENQISTKADYTSHGEAEKFKAWLEAATARFGASGKGTKIVPEFEKVD
jgi:thiol:disulfide interchange protein DsbD